MSHITSSRFWALISFSLPSISRRSRSAFVTAFVFSCALLVTLNVFNFQYRQRLRVIDQKLDSWRGTEEVLVEDEEAKKRSPADIARDDSWRPRSPKEFNTYHMEILRKCKEEGGSCAENNDKVVRTWLQSSWEFWLDSRRHLLTCGWA